MQANNIIVPFEKCTERAYAQYPCISSCNSLNKFINARAKLSSEYDKQRGPVFDNCKKLAQKPKSIINPGTSLELINEVVKECENKIRYTAPTLILFPFICEDTTIQRLDIQIHDDWARAENQIKSILISAAGGQVAQARTEAKKYLKALEDLENFKEVSKKITLLLNCVSTGEEASDRICCNKDAIVDHKTGKCLLLTGKLCTKNSECVSGQCSDNICD